MSSQQEQQLTTDEMVMMRPLRCPARSSGRHACVVLSTPNTLMSKMRLQAANGYPVTAQQL